MKTDCSNKTQDGFALTVCSDGEFDFQRALANVVRFAVVTTDRCQARCAHCLMRSAPDRTARLRLSQIVDVVDCMLRKAPVKMVVFTGGESTLLKDDLLEAVSYCADRGVFTRLVTNAAWAMDDASTERMIRDLRDAGLSEINFSTDDFHSPFVSLENVKRAWLASKGMGFMSVLIALCCGPNSRITAESVQEYLNETIEVYVSSNEPEKFVDYGSGGQTKYLISKSQISKIGRGKGLPSGFFYPYETFKKSQLYGPCPNLMDPPTLNPDGTLGACCGVCTEDNKILNLGDSYSVLRDDACRIDEFQSLILKAIQTLGPAYLYHLATESASEINRMQARSVCEICEKLTTSEELLNVLRKKKDLILHQISLSVFLRRRINGEE